MCVVGIIENETWIYKYERQSRYQVIDWHIKIGEIERVENIRLHFQFRVQNDCTMSHDAPFYISGSIAVPRIG